MRKIIFATTNAGKMDEIRMILSDLEVEILSLKDANINVDIDENGSSFEENATIKAETIMKMTGEIILADDSGLEIDYLDKAPGIYSARFMGEDTSYQIKNQYIIEQLQNVKGDDRSARFVCAIACAVPNEETVVKRATIEGLIADKISGEHGFGYDPIFYYPPFGITTGEMTSEQKNEVSHRGKALRSMKEYLVKVLASDKI